MATAVASIMTANPVRSKRPGRWAPSTPPANALSMPDAPNSRPVRHRIAPERTCATSPASAVIPITNSEVVIACLASMPAT